MDEHKKKCNLSLVKCPLDKCSQHIKKLDLFDHISKLHSDQILNKFDSILKIFKSENDSNVKSKPSINMNNFSIDVQVLIFLNFIYVSQVFLLLQPLLKDFLVFVVSYVSKEQETVQMIY